LTELVTSFIANLFTLNSVAEWYSSTGLIGLVIIFLIIGVPIYILILASIVGQPRNLKVTMIFIAMQILLFILAIIFVWIVGGIVSMAVP